MEDVQNTYPAALLSPKWTLLSCALPRHEILFPHDHGTVSDLAGIHTICPHKVIARLPQTDFELPVAAVHDWLASRTPPPPPRR